MRYKAYFLFLLGGAFGVAACNPDSAGAQSSHEKVASIHDANSVGFETTIGGQNSYIIEIYKMRFQTPSMNVKIGDTVTWINRDIVPHTATAIDKSWDSGQLKKGESYMLTITSQTSLGYFCFYHRQMKAKLVLAVPH